jgi:hypothetical protein
MATGQGTGTFSFGAYPGTSETSVAITGQTGISATSKVECYIMGEDTTSDHNAGDHRLFAVWAALTAGTPTAATGFTAYATSMERLQGTYKFRWVWAD